MTAVEVQCCTVMRQHTSVVCVCSSRADTGKLILHFLNTIMLTFLFSLTEKGKLLFSRVEPQFSGSHSNSKHTYHGVRFALMKNWKSFHMISLSVWENVAKVVVVVRFNASFYLTVSENKLFLSNLCSTGNYMYKCFQCKNCWIDLYQFSLC